MSSYLIGHDVGGTKCAVILGKADGGEIEIIDRIQFPTHSDLGPEQTLVNFERYTKEIMTRNDLDVSQARAIGISCGGPISSANGTVLSPPNLPGWDEIHIVERFEKSFGLPVRLENDANACALAEWRWGAGKGCRNLIFMTFGTGLGAGLVLDGRLYSGTNDLAGEVGHVRLADDGPEGYGKRGSFEGFCSGGGIARLAREMALSAISDGKPALYCPTVNKLDSISARTVAEAANQGDPVAKEVYRIVGTQLGKGLAMLIDILNPEVIVIGSVFARQRDLLWPVAEKVINAEALPGAVAVCKVLPAALGEAIGDYASLSLAAG
ncbi:MAG: ROK family protein [Armatimonadota bacterium]